MKKITLITFLLFLVFGCDNKEKANKAALEKKNQQQALAVSQLKIEMLNPSAEGAVTEFFNRFCQLDTMGAARYVVSYREHVDIYPYTENPDSNAGSAEFAAQMFAAGNKKHYLRWLYRVATDTLTFSRVTFSGEEKKQVGYSFIKGIKIYLKRPSGEEVEFPMFDTLLKLPSGYKIWAFLDT